MLRFLFVLMNEYRIWGAARAQQTLEETYPGQFSISVYSVQQVNRDAALEHSLLTGAEAADMVFIASHGSIQNLYCFAKLQKSICGRCPVYFTSTMTDELSELLPQLKLTPAQYSLLDSYYQAGTVQDLEQLVLCAANQCFGTDYPTVPPSPPRHHGTYVCGNLLPVEQEDAYKERLSCQEKPVIGVLIHDHFLKTQNLRHVDALIAAIEEKGCAVYAIVDSFTSDVCSDSGILCRMEHAFRREDGTAIPSALVVTYGFSITTLSGQSYQAGQPPRSTFERWDIPVFQGLTTYFSEEEYLQNIRGLDLISLPICVYQPEFDGQLISVPFAVTQCDEEGRKVCMPLPDRVERLAQLACRWASLSRKPISQKRIAVILHNMPPREDTIGSAHGLDTPESVHRIVQELVRNGLQIEKPFEGGEEIISRIRHAVTNDNRWRSEDTLADQATATVDASLYTSWFQRLNPEVRRQMEQNWGPAPGSTMVCDNRILIPGILNGNLFIGLQPLRSSPENADSLYHSTDSTPPHSYLAFYRWIDEVFGADVILHVGTHGTLEWLPGKEVGLSAGCFPDICIGSIPHLYIYNIDILGEGMQAKRRSYACILDHLIPSMDESDAYGDLAALDEVIGEYYHARQAQPAQAREVADRIFAMAQEQELLTDLKTDSAALSADPDAGVALIHRWISRIKSSVVRDGLHIYGSAPEGIPFDNLARLLLRIPNGSVPALNDSILTALGWEPETLKEDSTFVSTDGRTALRIQEEAVDTARRIFSALSAGNYSPSCIQSILDTESFLGSTVPLKQALEFVCRDVVPKLKSTPDEMDFLLAGINGRFVRPLPGGSPSRGNVHILPTGRNFYSIDPSAIPSRAAWTIGQKLAKQAIEAYQQEHGGSYPESMAIVVYSDACMKTHGEDIAEVFALMGVRPVYLGESSKVICVEPIPLEELGRPRIDAVLRISGLFRDTFPNVVELVDRAVLTVVSLEETHEQNYVKKHTELERNKLIAEGLVENDAADQAALRVFGCPPGTYGAGVAQTVHSRAWESWEDFSKVYTLWSCHGYSSRYHGEAMPELFRSRLSTVGVTIKNRASVEIDLLDSDDFYSYHGGLIACVRESSGKKPISLEGLTADPEHPETAAVDTELARIMRSRILNPKWLEGLKRHGYKGAQEISTTFDTFFGWDACAEVAENWMYDRIAHSFLLNEETRKWVEQVNDASVFQMAERFLEAHQRGMWDARNEDLQAIRSIYMNAEGTMEDYP